MSSIQSLTPHSHLVNNDAGIPILTINNQYANAKIALHGAHLLSYQRHGESPSIWLSEKAVLDGSMAIRGGIPICWPWFGPAPTRVGENRPSHGFARMARWTLDGVSEHQDGTLITLSLRDSDETRAMWDHSFELELDILVGQELTVVLTTRNIGSAPLTYSGALHTYLQISAPEHVTVMGLGERYFNTLTGMEGRQQGALSLTGPVDRVYLDPESVVVVNDGARQTKIVSGNHDSIVVWTPWQQGAQALKDMADDGYLQMLCVEAAIADAAGVTVLPDEEHSLSTVII